MKNTLWIVLAIIVIAGGAWLYSQNDSSQPQSGEQVTDQQSPDSEDQAADPASGTVPRASEITNDPLVETAALVAVDGSSSNGTGYKLLADKYLVHYVEAEMPDPAEGSVYEGWLVQPEPLNFFSTGVMKKNSEGMWELEYIAEGQFPTHTRVVITEETVVDETPEKHIIEGDF